MNKLLKQIKSNHSQNKIHGPIQYKCILDQTLLHKQDNLSNTNYLTCQPPISIYVLTKKPSGEVY